MPATGMRQAAVTGLSEAGSPSPSFEGAFAPVAPLWTPPLASPGMASRQAGHVGAGRSRGQSADAIAELHQSMDSSCSTLVLPNAPSFGCTIEPPSPGGRRLGAIFASPAMQSVLSSIPTGRRHSADAAAPPDPPLGVPESPSYTSPSPALRRKSSGGSAGRLLQHPSPEPYGRANSSDSAISLTDLPDPGLLFRQPTLTPPLKPVNPLMRRGSAPDPRGAGPGRTSSVSAASNASLLGDLAAMPPVAPDRPRPTPDPPGPVTGDSPLDFSFSPEAWSRCSWGYLRMARYPLLLLGLSVTGLVPFLLLWLPMRYRPEYAALNNVDVARGAAVRTPDPTFAEELLRDALEDFIAWLFLPIAFMAYLRLSLRRCAVVVAVVLVSFGAHKATKLLVSRSLGFGLSLLPLCAWVPALRLVAPGAGAAALQALVQVASVSLCFALIFLMNLFFDKFVVLSVVVVCAKECTGAVVRWSILQLSAPPHGSGAAWDPESTWPLFLWHQVCFALLLRFNFAEFSIGGVILGTVLQSALEVALRLTMQARDIKLAQLRMLLLRKLWRRAGPEDFQPQSTPEAADSAPPSLSPGPPGPAGGGGPAAPRAARSVAEQAAASVLPSRVLYCKLLLGDMLAEYVAIVTVPLLLVLFEGAKLGQPLEYYQHLPRPFDAPLPLRSLLLSFLIQLVGEALSDSVCCFVERRRGLFVREEWLKLWRVSFVVMFIGASWFAHVAMRFFKGQQDNFTKCRGRDLCLCANGNGLHPHGLRQRYCQRLQGNASAVGGGANATVALRRV